MTEWHGRRGGPGRGALVAGLGLLAVGVIAFLGSVGAIAVSAWTTIVAVVLVIVGAAVVVVAILPRGSGTSSVAVPLQDARAVSLVLGYGAGRLTLIGAPAGGPVVAIRSNSDDLRLDVRRDSDRAWIRVDRDGRGWDPFGAGDWVVEVSPDAVVGLEIRGGAGSFDVDLASLRIAFANLSVGAADVRCRLPIPVGDVRVRIQAGASSVRLEVPPGAPFRVRADGLLSRSGVQERPGYDAARDRLTIDMTGGVASLAVS
jgi:hypothetical protein